MAKHFLNNGTGNIEPENVEVQVTEEVKEGNYDLKVMLWSKEKYWQAQLFTLTHGMNSAWGGSVVMQRNIERRKNSNILVLVLRMFDFVSAYLKVQHLWFGLYAYLNMCLIYIIKMSLTVLFHEYQRIC